MSELMNHFGNDSRFSHSEEARRKQWFIKARQDQKLRNNNAEQAAESASTTAFAATVVMATDTQIDAFEAKLDLYDEATTAALIENQIEYEALQKRMIEIEARLEGIWQHANMMPDGRRVFLNSDRTQAYDEFGEGVSDAEYSYDQFPEGYLPVDEFLPDLIARGEVRDAMEINRADRDTIHEFDDLTDQYREELVAGGVTEERLDEMDAELLEAMPPQVAKHLPTNMNPTNAPDAKSRFAVKAAPLDLTKTDSTIKTTPAPDF